MKIVDTHLHLWDLNKLKLSWINEEYTALNKTFTQVDYLKALKSINVQVNQAIYIEVDADDIFLAKENELLKVQIADTESIVTAGIIKADLLKEDFNHWLDNVLTEGVKGVRHSLHVPLAREGTCLKPVFIENMQELGDRGLVFEACVRASELEDIVELAKQAPKTTIVLNHVGNIDCNLLINKNLTDKEIKMLDCWKRNIQVLGKLENVVCKLSGQNPSTQEASDSLVQLILDNFSTNNIIFGGNYPVSELGIGLSCWIKMTNLSLSKKDSDIQESIWFKNAERVYSLPHF